LITADEHTYLGWDLHLKPHEYWKMDAEEWHIANDVQAAYRQGAESAVEEHRKSQERDQQHKDDLVQLLEERG
jgi:hypothetical protein